MNKAPEVNHDENVAKIDFGDSSVKVAYSQHNIPQLFPTNAEDFVSDIDGVFLEGIGDYIEDPSWILTVMSESIDYSELVEESRKKALPIFLPDVVIPGIKMKNRIEMGITGVEGYAAFELALRARKKIKETEDKSRRNFMKLLGITAGAWLALPITAKAARVASLHSGIGQSASSALVSATHLSHPELYGVTVKLRSLIMAYKTVLMMRAKIVNNPALVVGGMHTDVVDKIIRLKTNDGEFMQTGLSLRKLFYSGDVTKSQTFHSLGQFQFEPEVEKWGYNIHDIPQLH